MNILFIHQNFPGQFRHLAEGGYRPDLVIANPGWGEALFVKDVFPQARLVCLLEFFHGTPDADFGFDPEFGRPTIEARMKHRLKNMALIEAMLAMDRGVAPTAWQASLPAPVRAGEPVVTFVNRNLEPYRGYHVFMRALPEIQRRLDTPRVHFLGQLPYVDYLRLLQVSAAHVYLTYPFVLSWSCLEAMSAGCHVLGSRTAPVQGTLAGQAA